jgi:tetratricopeptide (TPR) repeat protein
MRYYFCAAVYAMGTLMTWATVKNSARIGLILCIFCLASNAVRAEDPGIDYLQKGVQAYGANKNKEALRLFSMAIVAMPNEQFALLSRADALLQMKRPAETLKDLEKALKVSRYKGGTHSRLGLAYLEMHQPAPAEKELELAIKLNELDVLRWAPWLDYLNLAAAKQSLRKFDEANKYRALGETLRLQQDARETREALDMPKAMAVAEQAVKVQPGNTYSHYIRGVIRLNAGLPAKAIEDFSIIIKKQPEEALPYYFRADAYCDANRLEEAIKDYSKIIALAPPVVAVVDVAETGRCKSAGKAYDESAVTLSDIYYLRANAYRRLKKLALARADLNMCMKLDSSDLEAKILNVDFLVGEGKKAEALNQLQRLVKDNPQNIHCLQLIAATYTKLGMLDKALETADQLVRSSKNETTALICRAQIYQHLNRWKDSITDYSLALKNDDFNDDALMGRARAFAQLGDWQGVLKDCNSALKYSDSPKPEISQLKAKALQKLGQAAK